MPTTNRFHRNGATRPTVPQPQKTPPTTDNLKIADLKIAHSNGRKLVRLDDFPLSVRDWEAACRKNIALHGTGRNFYTEAIQAGLSAESRRVQFCGLVERLDDAVRKLTTLDQLFSAFEENGATFQDKKSQGDFELGKFLLMRSALDDLSNCRDAIWSTAYQKTEAA